MGVLAIHMILLPNKSLLIFNRSRPGGGGGEADFGIQLIAPGASGDYAEGGDIFYPTINSAVRELFCAGHTLDPIGRTTGLPCRPRTRRRRLSSATERPSKWRST